MRPGHFDGVVNRPDSLLLQRTCPAIPELHVMKGRIEYSRRLASAYPSTDPNRRLSGIRKSGPRVVAESAGYRIIFLTDVRQSRVACRVRPSRCS